MSSSRTAFGKTNADTPAKLPAGLDQHGLDNKAEPPRWGLLAAAILAAAVTAAWVGNGFAGMSTPQPQTQSSAATVK